MMACLLFFARDSRTNLGFIFYQTDAASNPNISPTSMNPYDIIYSLTRKDLYTLPPTN